MNYHDVRTTMQQILKHGYKVILHCILHHSPYPPLPNPAPKITKYYHLPKNKACYNAPPSSAAKIPICPSSPSYKMLLLRRNTINTIQKGISFIFKDEKQLKKTKKTRRVNDRGKRSKEKKTIAVPDKHDISN